MTTTISPSIGHAVWTQGGVGASPGYDCVDARRAWTPPERGEGVSTYGSFRVSQRGAGANMSVDIAMDEKAYVRGDAIAYQQIYDVAVHSATINEAITAAHATLPRIDQVVLEVKDHQHDASGSSLAQTRVVDGTPTGGATLDNRTGAAALPSSALLLADVLVAAADTAISNAEIRDRRTFSGAGTAPPLLTAVDMVMPVAPHVPLNTAVDVSAAGDLTFVNHDTKQVALLLRLDRRIAGATRLRWRYVHGATALAGSYVFALFDATGRKIVDTGSVAFTGAANSVQLRSETIAASTFEPGYYYGFFGNDTTAGVAGTSGWGVFTAVGGTNTVTGPYPNAVLGQSGGGLTVPSTILSAFTDQSGASPVANIPRLPQFALSVG